MGERAAIYCRVSTEGQGQDGTSLDTQMDACLKYCRHGAVRWWHGTQQTFSAWRWSAHG